MNSHPHFLPFKNESRITYGRYPYYFTSIDFSAIKFINIEIYKCGEKAGKCQDQHKVFKMIGGEADASSRKAEAKKKTRSK